MLEVVIE